MKTTNLQLSQELKANGYPQEGYFWWSSAIDRPFWKLENREFFKIDKRRDIASPTADEILERLPVRTEMALSIRKGSKEYHCHYWWGTPSLLREGSVTDYWATHADNPIDALAKMWLYLKQNGLLEV